MDQKGKRALVTGASSGIGLELARIHAQHGGDLVLVARRGETLEEIKKEFEHRYGVSVQVIAKDLSQPTAAQEVHREVVGQVDYLINNAGFGLAGLYVDSPWDRNKEMIDLNITALAELTRLFLPDMIKKGGGRILNVSSIAGFLPGPLQATYYASKAFVTSFSQAVANEVAPHKVTVSVLCPGPVQTSFGKVAGLKVTEKSTLHGVPVASAEETARVGYNGMLKGKLVIVSGFFNKVQVMAMRFAPRGLLLKISRRVMEMFIGK